MRRRANIARGWRERPRAARSHRACSAPAHRGAPIAAISGNPRRAGRGRPDGSGAPPGGPSLGGLEHFIGFHLRLAQDASFRAFALRTRSMRIRPGRFAAMMVISNNPGITPSALGRAIARDKSTLTPLIKDLQRRGLVTRRSSRRDRRSANLALTPAGQAVLRDLVACAREHDRQLDAIVGRAKPQLLKLLKSISDGLAD